MPLDPYMSPSGPTGTTFTAFSGFLGEDHSLIHNLLFSDNLKTNKRPELEHKFLGQPVHRMKFSYSHNSINMI